MFHRQLCIKIMKKTVLYTFLVCFQLSPVQAQNTIAKDQFIFKGKIVEQPEGFVYLSYINKDDKYIRDSCKLKEGKFEFQGFINEPTEADFGYKTNSGRIDNPNFTYVFLEQGVIHAIFKMNHFKHGKITGSKTQNEYAILNKDLSKINKSRDSIIKDYREAKRRNDTDKVNKLQKKLGQDRIAHYKVDYEFINDHPDSYVSVNILHMLSGGHLTLDSVKMFYERLSPTIQQSRNGRSIKKYIKRSEAVAIGKPAPDFIQNNLYGHPVSLKSFKGKYVLLDFWASWCIPCRQENPYLVEAYKKYKNKDFTIVGISLDTDTSKWEKAIKQDNLNWTQLSDLTGPRNSIAQKYNVIPIPDNFLIDPDGIIIARGLRGEEILKKMKDIFKTR